MNGYGFLAVFVAAVMVRRSEDDHEFHQTLHDFAEQAEQLLMTGLAVLFVVRPLTARLGRLRTTTPKGERAAIAFFGIRGIGSLYYLAYALNEATFSRADLLWALVAFTVVVSIAVHGTTATLVTRRLDAVRDHA